MMRAHEQAATIELDLRLRQVGENRYAVDMDWTPAPELLADALVRGVEMVLDPLVLLAENPATPDYGRFLGAMLFAAPELRRGWEQVRLYSQGRGARMRVRLHCHPGDLALHDLAWEAAHEPCTGAALALGEEIYFSRHLVGAGLEPVVVPPQPDLSALVVAASPRDLHGYGLDPFDAPAFARQAREALAPIPTTVLASGGPGERPTFAQLEAALREGPHILYLICHGVLIDDEIYLWLENTNGAHERIAGGLLAQLIRTLTPCPLLVILAACESAGRLAARLARAGVPAIVVMQGNVGQATVAGLMPRLFAELRRDGQIDRALAVARASLQDEAEAWRPALFLRTRDGRLWRETGNFAAAAPGETLIILAPFAGGSQAGRLRQLMSSGLGRQGARWRVRAEHWPGLLDGPEAIYAAGTTYRAALIVTCVPAEDGGLLLRVALFDPGRGGWASPVGSGQSLAEMELGRLAPGCADGDLARQADHLTALALAVVGLARGEPSVVVAGLTQALAGPEPVAGPDIDRAAAFYWRGIARLAEDRFPIARADLERSLDLRPGAAQSCAALGAVLLEIGQLDAARHYFGAALAAAAPADIQLRASLLLNTGLTLERQGDLAAALDHYRQAENLYPDDRPEAQALAMLRLGSLAQRVAAGNAGDFDEAFRCYNHALELSQEHDLLHLVAVAYGNLALVYRARGQIELARHHYELALAIDERLGSRSGQARHLLGIGQLQLATSPAAATETFRRALALFEQSGSLIGQGQACAGLAMAAERSGDMIGVAAWLERGCTIFTEVGSPDAEAVCQALEQARRQLREEE